LLHLANLKKILFDNFLEAVPSLVAAIPASDLLCVNLFLIIFDARYRV
jgi:hypothetical protein